MKWTSIAAVAVLLILGILAQLLRRSPASLGSTWPLTVRRRFLSPPEQILYHRLVHCLPGHLIFAQVQVSRFLEVGRGVPRQTWFNRISQLSVDFLIVHPDTSILAAIELDDATHARAGRRDADARKAHALQSAGVKLIRWHVKALPDETAIRAALLGRNATGGLAGS